MSVQHEHTSSLSRSVFALLSYYRSGSIQTFFSIVERALAFSGHSVDTTQLAAIRRLLYNRLLLFGFIESSEVRGQRRWSSGPNRLVHLPFGWTILIGNTRFVSEGEERLTDVQSRLHVLYRFPNATRLSVDLCCRAYDIDFSQLDSLAVDLECELVHVSPQRLADLLPPISRVYCSVAIPGLDPAQIDASTELKRLEATTGEWVDANARSLVEGLYRIPHVFGQHRDIVVKKGLRSHVGFEVQDREWSLLIGAHLLRENLGWRYDAEQETLAVPAWQVPFLPMLLKRVLSVGAMQWPKVVDGYYFFGPVPAMVARRVAIRYPMLGINYV